MSFVLREAEPSFSEVFSRFRNYFLGKEIQGNFIEDIVNSHRLFFSELDEELMKYIPLFSNVDKIKTGFSPIIIGEFGQIRYVPSCSEVYVRFQLNEQRDLDNLLLHDIITRNGLVYGGFIEADEGILSPEPEGQPIFFYKMECGSIDRINVNPVLAKKHLTSEEVDALLVKVTGYRGVLLKNWIE